MKYFAVAIFSLMSKIICAQTDIYYDKPLEKGYHRNGERVGVWEFYSTPSTLNLRVNYANGQVLYVKPDTSQFVIWENNSWVNSRLDMPCVLHGVPTLLPNYYSDKFILPYQILKKAPTSFSLLFEIHEDGVARNPSVVNDPGYGVKENLLKLFNESPNSWIAGRKGGKAVKTRFAVNFCISETAPCELTELKTLKATEIYRHNYFRSNSSSQPTVKLPYDNDAGIIHWSPGDKKVAVSVGAFGRLKDLQNENQTFIIDTETGKLTIHQYPNPLSYLWLSEDKILLRYIIPRMSMFMAEFDLNTLTTKPLKDSLTFFNVTDQRNSKTAFLWMNKQTNMWSLWEKKSGNSTATLLSEFPETKKLLPVSYSPDGTRLIALETSVSDVKNYVLFDIATRQKTFIPVLYAGYSGWSADGKTIYLSRLHRGQYENSSTIFWYDIQTNTFGEFLEKTRKINGASYGMKTNHFLLFKNDGIYLLKNEKDSKPVLLAEDVHNASWSNDGNQIAYIRDHQLYVMNVGTRESKKITNLNVITDKR